MSPRKASKIVELMFDLVWETQIRNTSITDITTIPYTISVPGGDDPYVHVVFESDLSEEQQTAISDRWTTSAADDQLRNEIRQAKTRLQNLADGTTPITNLSQAVPELRFLGRVVLRLVEQEEKRLFPQ